jgi:hypothetical protein
MAFISSELAAVLAGVKDFTPAAALAVEAALRNLDGIRLLIMSLRRAALAARGRGEDDGREEKVREEAGGGGRGCGRGGGREVGISHY